MHEPRLITVDSRALGQLKCMDYAFNYLSELVINQVMKSTDSPNYMAALEESISHKGMLKPLTVIRYENGTTVLADGHHRAVLAYNRGWVAKAEVIDCHCPEEEKDFLGICNAYPARLR